MDDGRDAHPAALAAAAAGAAEIAPGVGLVTGEDGGGLVSVHGLATFAWDGGDEAGLRLAAVQLVRLRAVSQAQAAAAFGVDPVTVWRRDQALAAGGLAGLVPARRGPKGASKLTPQLAERIAGLEAAGATLVVGRLALSGQLYLRYFHAASCRFRYSSWASCGVL